MEPLYIIGTEQTPAITLDKGRGAFEISGRSTTDDAVTFFKPVLEWITNYGLQPNPLTECVFKLEYYNTATSKVIFDILTALERIEGAKVVWIYAGNDRDMEESGLDFAELVNVPFEFKTI